MSVACSVLLAALAFLTNHFVSADPSNINLCGQYDSHNFTSVPYSFNNNAWGNDSATASGYQCLDIDNGGKDFCVTYKWAGDASVVKAYPYMKAHPTNYPVQLWNISQLVFSGSWATYVTSTQNATSVVQAEAFNTIALRSNVAIDMFLSDNETNSTMISPPIEIMIWPWWIPTVKPLGWTESTPQNDTVMVAGTNFSLYHGYNDGGQHVFSWLAQQNLTSTNADYSPLLKYIWQKGMLSGALWVGSLEFGTEILHAADETKFEASNMTLRFIRQGDADDVKTTSTSSTFKPTSTAGLTHTGTQPAAATVSPTKTSTSTSSAHHDPVSIWPLLALMVIGLLNG